MPDLSDKVSERPDEIPEDVWEAAFLVANNLNCDFSFDGQTGGDVELREAQADIARAIMADRRTRSPASSMEAAESTIRNRDETIAGLRAALDKSDQAITLDLMRPYLERAGDLIDYSGINIHAAANAVLAARRNARALASPHQEGTGT